MDPRIIYEDNDILIVDKPYGMVVNRAESVKARTIQDWVEENFNFLPQNGSEFRKRSGVVHRLDKETSGLLLIAKNEKSFLFLQEQFAKRKVKKKYLALVHGRIKEKRGSIEVGVKRNPKNRHRFMVSLAEGKPAKTLYKVKNYYLGIGGEVLTLVEVIPLSGRTHQIRVHFKFINHPIVADLIYSGRQNLRKDLQIAPRLFLHASYLSFFHPKEKENREFFSDLPNTLKKVLRAIN